MATRKTRPKTTRAKSTANSPKKKIQTTRRSKSPAKASILLEPEGLRQMIAERAYYLFIERGCEHGYDLDDWLEAQALVLEEIC